MRKIVIATDSFKESLEAIEVANLIKQGFSHIFPETDIITYGVADGGEGTVETLVASLKGDMIRIKALDALNREIDSFYGIDHTNNTAIIEMAAASGLEQIDINERNPLITNTFGTGQLIIDALDRGCRNFIIGIGGSATNDAGMGMIAALGGRFLDMDYNVIEPCGGNLKLINSIDLSGLDPRLKECEINIAVDVTNPLYGKTGAAYVFGLQKGATKKMIVELDLGLQKFAQVVQGQFNIDLQQIPGTGAAGGLGGAFNGLLNAKLKPGSEIINSYLKIEGQIEDCDLVIVGEGRMDSQSVSGKAPIGVAKLAKKYDKPVIAICGSLAYDAVEVYDHGVDAIYSVVIRPCELSEALVEAEKNILLTSESIAKTIKLSQK